MRIPLTAIATTAIAATLVGVSPAEAIRRHRRRLQDPAPPHTRRSVTTHAPDQGWRYQGTRCLHRRPPTKTQWQQARRSRSLTKITATRHRHHPVLPDIEAAASALDSAKATHRETLLAKSLNARSGWAARRSRVVVGHSKGVTVLVFH